MYLDVDTEYNFSDGCLQSFKDRYGIRKYQRYGIIHGRICLRMQMSRDTIVWYAIIRDANVQEHNSLVHNYPGRKRPGTQ